MIKLRCAPDSIRLRLRKTALQELAEQGKVVETILFPNGQQLVYGLEIKEDRPELPVHFQDGVLMIHLPALIANEWISSDQVGLETDQALPNNGTLHILVEKDFPCQHKEGSENQDTFQELAKKKS